MTCNEYTELITKICGGTESGKKRTPGKTQNEVKDKVRESGII